jgi:hypothetical protein
MSLFQAERHEALSGGLWREDRAREAIARIVADTHQGFSAEGLWPIHSFDRSEERPPDSLKSLYHGAAGVIWALDHLAKTGATTDRRDYRPALNSLIARNRHDLETWPAVASYMGHEQAALLVGETGILLLQAIRTPSEEFTPRLQAAIAATVGDTRGLVWGGAGAMLAAIVLHERTGDPVWRALVLEHFEGLWDRWAYDENVGCRLWNQDLYGVSERRLGALHGFAANAFPLIRGRDLLPPERLDETLRRVRQTVRATALSEAGGVNWPVAAGATTSPLFVQHCNGAPGFINILSSLPDDAEASLDPLLLQAGELVWTAGPPVKFPSLCHGAAGSGYAFLKLYARTGDSQWLERARRFAMHGVDQAERALAQYGQRKFSLWTGDLGLAIFLSDCIGGPAQFPMLDVF